MVSASSAGVTLIVATKGRMVELDRLLSSLHNQTYANFSVYIADQNPPGFLDDIFLRHGKILDIKRVPAPDGVSAARNACFDLPLGQYIGFPDDDCWYEPDSLERLIECFKKIRCDAVVGVSPGWGRMARARYSKKIKKYALFQKTPTWAYFITHDALLRTGGFDVEFGPGPASRFACGEDSDYLLRIHAAHGDIFRCPKLRINHPEPDFSLPEAQQRAYAYGKGRAYLLKKHRCGMLIMTLNVIHPLFISLASVVLKGKRSYYWQVFLGRFAGLVGRL